MLETTSAKKYRINVKNLVYAMLLTDTSSGCTYGTPKRFASARQIQVSPTIATGELYGDGVREETASKITGYDVSVDINKVPVEVQADVGGHTINNNGVLVKGADDEPPYIALGYEVEETGNGRELVWLLKGKAQPIANTVQQSEANINYSTDSIKFSFICRDYDKNFQAIGDTAYPTFTDALAATFLTTVPTTLANEE